MNILKKITNNISKVIIGKDESIELAAIALIAKGHILLEDVPGTGKTTLAKSLAKSVDAKFQRIQFTADTLPGDVIGLEYFDVKESEFKTRLGPIFASIVVVDEINRACTENTIFVTRSDGRTYGYDCETDTFITRTFFSNCNTKSTRIRGHISVTRCSIRPVFTYDSTRLSDERS